jgi:hypothetical protein
MLSGLLSPCTSREETRPDQPQAGSCACRFGITGKDVYIGPYTNTRPDGVPWQSKSSFVQLVPSNLFSVIAPEGPTLLPTPVTPYLGNLGGLGLPSGLGGSDGNDPPTTQQQGSPSGTAGGGGPAVGAGGDNAGDSGRTAAIAGIAAGAATGPLLVVVGVLLYFKYRQRRSYGLPSYSSKSSSSAAPSLLTWLTFKVRP